MPNKITLRINGKESQLSADTWQQNGGTDGYAKDYGDALQIRVKAKDGSTGFIPVTDWGNAKGQGYQLLTTYYGEPKTRQKPYGVVDQPLNNGERGAQGIPDDAQPISPVQPHNPQQVAGAPIHGKSPRSLQPSLTPGQQARLSQQMTRFKRWLHVDNVTPDTSKATSLIDSANKNLFGTIKKEEARRSHPIGKAYSMDEHGNVVENKTAEKYLLRTQGQQEDMVNESLQGISDQYGKGVADKAIGIGNMKATKEALQSANDKINGISPVAGDTNGLQQWSGVANANRHTDPKAILSDATNILKVTFNNKQFIDNARAEAKRIGMDEQEYIKAAKENTSEQVKKDIYTKLIQSEMPKSHIDYIMKGLSNSIAGLVVGGINKTKGQREVAAIASQMTEQGQNTSFTPNFWDKLGSVSASFVADAPFFGISGELSGQAIKGIAERQLTRLTATGMSKGAAQRVIASKMRSSFGARMADMVGKGAIGGGINLGAYNALHETARQLADQDINPESLAKETAKGIVTGAALGVGGGLTNAATYELSGLPKVLGKVGGFGTEGLIFTATGRALDGSDKSWVDDLASSYAQLAVMKLTSSPAKTLDNIANFRKAFDHSAGDRGGGLKFTQEEQNEIKQSTGGKGLVESLTGAEAYVSRWRDREAKADAGKEGKGLVTLENGERLKGEDEMIRKNLSDNYENLMRDKNISYSTKQKVRYLLGGKMDIYVPLASGYTTDSDGKTFTVTTNDKDGNRIERRTFKSEQEANDYTDKLKEAIDKDVKSEKDYSAALAAYNDLIAQDGASEADIKRVIRGETTGDEQKDYAIKSRYTQLFSEYAKQQPRPTRNAEQPQENQGRIEGESVQPTEQPIGAQSKVPQNVEGNNDGLLKEQEAKGSDTEQTTLEETQANSYQNGYDAPDEQKNDVKRAYEKAQTRLASMLPDNIEEIENHPMDFVRDNPKFPTLSEEQKNAVYDYVQAKTSFDGMVHHVQDEMDARVTASDKEVDGRVSQVDGAIHPISLKTIDDNGHDKKAYIINGNVQMLPDGTMVNTEKSDKTIVIRDAVTGETSMIDPREILSMDEPIDAEQEKRTAADAIRQAYSKQEADKIDGVLPFAPGDTYAVVDGQGHPHNVSIVGDAVDDGTGQPIEGAVLATVDGQQAILPKDQIQAMSDAAKDATEVKRDSIPYPFELNDEFVITTTDGRDVRGTITAGADSDGNVQIATEEPVNGQMVSVVSPDELSRSIKEYNGMTATQQEEAQPAEQSVVDSAPIKDISAETSQDIVPQPENAMQDAEVDPTVVTQQDVAKDELPRDDDGNLVYDKVPVQKTIEDLYDGSLDDNEIKDFVDTNIKESDKAYKVLEKKAPKMGANKAKYLAAKNEWQSNLDEAKRKADYWKEVHAEQQRITNTTPDQVQEAQDELSGKNAVDELNANKEQVTFTSPLDMATQFVRGAKITPKSFQKETGLTTADQGKYVGMISNVGKSIERLGEELATMDDNENGGAFFHGDSNEARGAIIEALGEIRGKGGKKAQDMAEQDAAIAAYAQQRDNVFHENYGMGYEDYLAFEERFLPDMLRKYSNFDEDDYNNTYADEIAAQLKQDESYGREPITEGEQPGNDTSAEVLQGSPSDDTGGVAVPGDEGRQVETGSDSYAQDGTVSEEPRGEVNHETEKFTPSSKKDGEDLFGYAERVLDEHKRKKEEENVDTNPSEAQKEAAQPQVGTPSLNLNGDHRPVLDTGLAPVMYEVTDNIQPVITSGEAQKISPEDVADLIIANMDKSPYPKSMALQLAKINANNRPLFNDWVHKTFDGWLNGILGNAPDVYEMIRPIFDDDVQMQKSVRAVGKKLWQLAQETTTPELTEDGKRLLKALDDVHAGYNVLLSDGREGTVLVARHDSDTEPLVVGIDEGGVRKTVKLSPNDVRRITSPTGMVIFQAFDVNEQNDNNNAEQPDPQQTAANTETVAGQAETVASTAETYNDVNAARPNEKEYNEVIDKIDDELDKVNTQLDLFSDLFADEQTSIEENTTPAPVGTSLQRKFALTVKSDMLSALDTDTKPYRSIIDLRKRASELGMEVDNDGRTDILLQELVEDGLVRAAREVVKKYGRDSRESYDLVCKLYDMQPTIAARSSNRIKMQQYSTPLPMSWIADRFAMEAQPSAQVLEPTAGNGMLVFTIPVEQVHANELDETRLDNLREQGFAQVTHQDATEPFEGGKKYDAVIANPPFGKREAVEYDGKMIPGLDPQITLNALASMKDDGRASIIIGGNMEYASNGGLKGLKPFFTYLYDHYNVSGVIDMDGKLYAKQGTTFPTRMILINGRRSEEERAQTAIYPPVHSKALRKAESFEDLNEILNEVLNSNEKTNGTEILRSRERKSAPVNNQPSGRTDGEGHREQPRKNDTSGRGERGERTNVERSSKQSEGVLRGERRENTGNGEDRNTPARSERGDSGRSNESDTKRVDGVGVSPNGVGLKTEQKKRTLTEEKLSYRPHNGAFSLNSVAPAAMVEAMDNVLSQIEKEYGNIDEFIKSELGYATIEEAHAALASEQMDSVAMAIYQMKKGQALIIGDQTGVGKGRQMAALIRWAVMRGEKPVFITQKADLFSDIYRDLVDVGSGDLKPFIFNSDGAMVDAKGNTVHKPLSQKEMAKVFASGELPEDYDFAVLTYSQVNTGDAISQQELEKAAKKRGARVKKSKASKEGKATPKATFLRAIAKDNYLFLDESHTAAGSSNTGAYLQSILRSAKGATFASATFAKRPDTMPLYAIRTAMSQAKVEPDKMIGIVEKGGVTLQEIMSRELTNAGQMVRRERDMSDVKTDWKTINDPETVKRARENYDKTISAFNAIIKFQEDYVKPKIEELDMELAITAESAGVKRGTDKMGVENVPFASKTYNYTKQLMLALKVDAIADEVEAEINAGRHPVIALESTMESTIKDYSAGDVIAEPTFSASLLKGLDSVMQYTVKDEDGKERHAYYTPKQLGEAGEKAYYELQQFIRESTSGIFISPLDAIIERLYEKGYKVGELTGRNMYVERNAKGEVVVKRRTDKDKKKMQREFNDGTLDVLILNKSASTGISLHASERFSDQRQRTMIIAQPLSDINDYMQMIGRIDRTGQVHRGYYINLGLPVPAENRFLMMLSTKLKSLNANTTTSQDSESNDVEAPDLLNKYGSQVVVEYLRDNVEVYEKMGAPLKKAGTGAGRVQARELEEYKPQEDDARKVTGYVALLSTKEQDEFYDDVVRRYNELIKYLNDTGSNDLKISVMPLRATTLDKRVSSEGIDPNGSNPFARNSYVERVEMDVLRKPMKAEEVKKVISQINNGNADEHLQVVKETIHKEDEARIAAENERYEKAKSKAAEDIAKQTEKINRQQKRTAEEKSEAIARVTADTNERVEAKHQDNMIRLNSNSDQLLRRLDMFEVGKSYLVPETLESMVFDFASPAIFCGYKAKDKKITASTTLAVFATLDGRRRVEVKLSDFDALSSIDKMTNDNWDAARATTMDNWDEQIPNETRKQGFIMTGNILQAIADTQDEHGGYSGQLISYTDIDGNVHDGILMPDKWNASMLKTSGAPISIRLKQIQDYQTVESADGKVRIDGSSWGKMHYLVVPKTKKDGAMFYENKRILNAVSGSIFYPYRGQMRADIPADKIKVVVDELSKLGVKVKSEEDNDTLYRSDDTFQYDKKIEENANTPTPEQREIGNALIDSIRKCGVTVHTDVKEMEDALSNIGIQFLHTKDGNVYGFVKDGEIYLDNALLDTNSPVHEYTHLWDSALQKTNPELWNHGKELMSQLPVWNEVLNDENYKDIKDNEDLVASEVHSRLSGAESERLFDEGINDSKKDGVFAEAEARTLIARIKNWLNDVWKWVKDTFTPWTKEEADKVPLKDFINMPIRDLLNGKKMPPVMGEKATIDKNDDIQYLIKEESSTGKPVSIDRVSVRGDYEKQIASGLYQFQEAMQDSMLGLKTLMMDIWKANGKEGHIFDIPGYENPYLLENAMSSANQAQAEIYGKMIIKPLIKAIAAFEGKGYKQDDVTDYMLAKHGLERNDYIRRKTAEEKLSESEYVKEIRKQERYLRTPEGKDDEAAKEKLANMKDQFDEMVIETMQGDDHDYSGITSLTKESDVWAAEEIARKMVNDFESNAGDEMTNNLWERTNDATKATLRKLYDSGLMTKANYEKVRDMYKNYVPLRGWDETTTEDVYTYMNHRDGAMRGSIMKKAEGRRSKADDPIATIEAMAEAGISQGNRNLMKQAFLNFVQNHPSDLVSVDDIWLKYNDVTEEWETVFPQLSNDDTAEDVRNKVEAFNQRMVELSNENPEKYKRGKDDVNIPYVVVPGTQSEHEILVRRGGRPYVMVINGNTRAAQAVNGLTNPDVEVGGAWGNILKGMEKVNRFISAMVTTRFPDFVASNFVRDAEYSNAMSWVKESPNYAARFGVNFAKNNPAMIGYLLNKFKKGNLDINDETQKMFQDFMMNGGETGYTIVRDIEAHKKKIHEEIRKANGKLPVKRAWQLLGEKFDDVNRSVENCARFNAFLTSRQFGRSVERAIWDAKEVSVNFNKKGAGARFLGTKGMTTLGNTGAFMSGVGRTGFIFWNAGVQGLYNSGGTTLRNPKKALSLMASLFLLGSIIPSLSGDGGDDDKNNYYNLPSAIRRTSICFRVGDVWLSIPLAIEYRALYGLGELATSVMSGNEKHDDKELVAETMKQLTQIMPLDFMEGGGGFGTLVPSSVKPIYESINNEDWTGLPLYKETPYNTNKPDWTKAYKNANKELVDIAKGVSRATGGNDAKKGAVDVNPAEVENILEGYLGGAARTVNMLVKSGETMFANRDFEWRNVPIANRFIKGTDERTQLKAVKDRYYNYLDEFNETKRLEREYKNRADKGVLEYAEELNFLYNSKEYLRMTITEDFVKEIGKLNEQKNNADDDNERKAIESEQDMLMTEVVNILQQQEENK